MKYKMLSVTFPTDSFGYTCTSTQCTHMQYLFLLPYLDFTFRFELQFSSLFAVIQISAQFKRLTTLFQTKSMTDQL